MSEREFRHEASDFQRIHSEILNRRFMNLSLEDWLIQVDSLPWVDLNDEHGHTRQIHLGVTPLTASMYDLGGRLSRESRFRRLLSTETSVDNLSFSPCASEITYVLRRGLTIASKLNFVVKPWNFSLRAAAKADDENFVVQDSQCILDGKEASFRGDLPTTINARIKAILLETTTTTPLGFLQAMKYELLRASELLK